MRRWLETYPHSAKFGLFQVTSVDSCCRESCRKTGRNRPSHWKMLLGGMGRDDYCKYLQFFFWSWDLLLWVRSVFSWVIWWRSWSSLMKNSRRLDLWRIKEPCDNFLIENASFSTNYSLLCWHLHHFVYIVKWFFLGVAVGWKVSLQTPTAVHHLERYWFLLIERLHFHEALSVGFLQRKGGGKFPSNLRRFTLLNLRMTWPTSSHSEDSCSRRYSKNISVWQNTHAPGAFSRNLRILKKDFTSWHLDMGRFGGIISLCKKWEIFFNYTKYHWVSCNSNIFCFHSLCNLICIFQIGLKP